jgi:cell division septum initiation protein DivIVA
MANAGYANRLQPRSAAAKMMSLERAETGLGQREEEPSAEAIGRALAAAAALGEQMVAEATQRAEELRTKAEAEAAQLLSTARAEVSRLEREADQLRSFLESATNEFVATARAALEQLDELEGAGRPPTGTAHARDADPTDP